MTAGEKLKAWARRIKRDGVTLWFACKSPQTPWYAKTLGAFVVAYALSPIDLIPDFIPVIGYLDDLILVPLGILMLRRLIPEAVLTDCRRQAQAAAYQRKPANWIAGTFIITLWISCAALFTWWIWHLAL